MHLPSVFTFGFTAVRAVFGTPIPRLPTSSGNITAYSNNAHIVSMKSLSVRKGLRQGMVAEHSPVFLFISNWRSKTERFVRMDIGWNIKANKEAKRAVSASV
ncbi:uncharacterized protein EAF02_011577 [Botrytis sinoallii]|uniref:uncharacterized protein n=1 Tax=Botrytis sinoallii TaxID=1463999 RepID=UPI001901A917|nr:uncharacterized protein EAF02_011577 [Botrytis sinoallii]KAF7855318.1 hypothetical protein EAF02_011577 [Botrytis sinoallii]